MSSASPTDKISISDRLFLLFAIMGPAASYSIVYIFHFLLIKKILYSVFSLMSGKHISIQKYIRYDFLFLIIFISWYTISISWSPNLIYAIKYCIYISLAIFTVIYVTKMCDTPDRLRIAVNFIIITLLIEIVLSSLEGMQIIRLPFSTFSPYQTYFGHTPPERRSLLDEQTIESFMSTPTGFMGNPNDLASFLALSLPFFLFRKGIVFKYVTPILILFVIYMADSRAALAAYCVVLILYLLMFARKAVRLVTIIFTIIFLLISAGLGSRLIDTMKESETRPIAELGDTGAAARNLVAGLLGGDDGASKGSVDVRVHLILNGLNALQASYGLGVGAGGSQSVQENSGDERLAEIGSMHNFWIELLVEGGIIFWIMFLAWYISLIVRLWYLGKNSSEPILNYIGRSLSLGFLCFLLGAIGPSSVIYMLPMWMLAGIALSAINLGGRADTRKDSRDARPPILSSTLPMQPPLGDKNKVPT